MSSSTPPFDPQKWAQPIPLSLTDTQPKSPNIVPDLSSKNYSTSKMNSVIESPHALPSLSGNPSSSRQLESMASSPDPPFETSFHHSGSLPNRAAATSKHLSKSGSSSNPSQKLSSLGTFKNIFANPSKSKSKGLASDSRSQTPWPQAPGGASSSSTQRSTTPATAKKGTGPEADFPKKPSSCFHPAGS
ncbi:hypothetical protein MMC29_001143 [Sticta canariensis]|nr:hypothetical protein [Sticta canariensis]